MAESFFQGSRALLPVPHIGVALFHTSMVSFEVIGSEDCNDWTVLLHNDDLKHSSKERAYKTWLVPYLPPFSCLGLRFQKIKNDYTYVCIRKIEMWEYP